MSTVVWLMESNVVWLFVAVHKILNFSVGLQIREVGALFTPDGGPEPDFWKESKANDLIWRCFVRERTLCSHECFSAREPALPGVFRDGTSCSSPGLVPHHYPLASPVQPLSYPLSRRLVPQEECRRWEFCFMWAILHIIIEQGIST